MATATIRVMLKNYKEITADCYMYVSRDGYCHEMEVEMPTHADNGEVLSEEEKQEAMELFEAQSVNGKVWDWND